MRDWITRIFCRLGAVATLCCLAPAAAFAICDVDYVAQPGDTLFSIAETHYGDRDRWTLLYAHNQSRLSGAAVLPGRRLFIPCAQEVAEADAPAAPPEQVELKLLTGDGYAPFTDRNLPGQGMVTELVNAALDVPPAPVSRSITWEDDWSRHLFPLLDSKEFDMGFPWVKPDCEAEPQDPACTNFHFSDPVMSLPIMLFVRVGSDMRHDSDADVLGKTLCRPAGLFTHDLNRSDRRWLERGVVTLVRPQTAEDCFQMVLAGQVDAVAVDLFLGASTLVGAGLRDSVVPLEKPLSEESLHVVISKHHWRGTTHLYRVNAGLEALRRSGRFEEIMSRHLELFWAQLQ
ncbi:transporter substrate-binding domain-containing protein [Leisingera sp. XS_AS12]|uniref:transporter substrate-binding domain-containing protein n=1 Tax=Leisingera sp. XS_AS12 TaxID=3241294 RepID=UPI0035115961